MLLTFSCQMCTGYVAPYLARTALFCPMLGTALETSGDDCNPVCCLKNIPDLESQLAPSCVLPLSCFVRRVFKAGRQRRGVLTERRGQPCAPSGLGLPTIAQAPPGSQREKVGFLGLIGCQAQSIGCPPESRLHDQFERQSRSLPTLPATQRAQHSDGCGQIKYILVKAPPSCRSLTARRVIDLLDFILFAWLCFLPLSTSVGICATPPRG